MKISDRQPEISDSLKNSDFSNSFGVLQHPQAPPAMVVMMMTAALVVLVAAAVMLLVTEYWSVCLLCNDSSAGCVRVCVCVCVCSGNSASYP